MIAEKLKKSIIEYGIQGKLTSRLKVDGHAANYYKPILKSMDKLIDRSNLFEIPENWIWVSLEQISTVISKGTTPTGGKEVYLNKGIPFVRAENISDNGKVTYKNIKFIDEDTHETKLKRSKLCEKDLLISIAGTLGRAAVLDQTYNKINANQAVSFVRLISHKDINVYFIRYCISSESIQKKLVSKNKVTAIPNLTLEIIKNTLIPLPPLAEQKRIVDKLDEILPIIDSLEKDESKLKDLIENFPERISSSILLYAMEGKIIESKSTQKSSLNEFVGRLSISELHQKFDDFNYKCPDNWTVLELDKVSVLSTGNSINETIKKTKYFNKINENI
jgi:type I restriction enzyme S subunit